MGISVKKYVEGNDAAWLIAENVFPYYSCLRSMASPKESKDGDQPCPDTYGGQHWVDPNNIAYDNGGVHINSGVQNKWFYLLSDGGTGTNDKNFIYDVTVKNSQSVVNGLAGKWYTLDGRLLEGQPTKKGMYINGNRKVVIK